jgi:acetyl-CoA synthetase
MGKPVPGVKAAILDDHFQPLKPNIVGNLAFRPGWPAMMSGTWKNPRLYQSYFSHGWFLTGDRARRDEQGYFWFSSRKAEIIKTAGERVGTFEVETALASHPAVLENAVVGKPDPLRGEIIKAFVVLRSGRKPSETLKKEIQTHVKIHLAGHAYPREIEFIGQLPRNSSGKILRRVLKNQADFGAA